ncbi:thiol reductant ABC exporter subunit CydC [Thiofilum flexile]|uniref:thiol reductant ABC exporter subunit CydC n=1 Tax=Thiofilum flexile TaxID=125627 RepID=UPI00036DD8EC|nr:thiol reductant ABC exporter subunit CydC [Thiofilum flexile]
MTELLRLFALMRPYWGWIVLGILLSWITTLANLALLAISGWFISAMALAGIAQASMNYFTPAALIRGAAITRTAGRYAERVVTHDATFKILSQLRVWLYEKIEPLAPAGLEHYHRGDVFNRIRADIEVLNQVYLRLLVPSIVAILTLIVLALVWCWFDWRLALVQLSLLITIAVGLSALSYYATFKVGKAAVQTRAELTSHLVDDLQAWDELAIYGALEQRFERFQVLNQTLIEQQRHVSRWNTLVQAALMSLGYLAMVVVLIQVIPLVHQGQVPPAYLALFTLLALGSMEIIQPLPLAVQSLGESVTAAKRIFSLADSPLPIQEPAQPQVMPQQFELRVQAVSYSYPNSQQPALRPLSFILRQGSSIALLGRSGVGKSTLVQLLTRLRPISTGHIYVNQTPIEQFESEALRSGIAVAMQTVQLFDQTIAANLRLAKPDATDVELEAACRCVQLHDFIQAQPQGYDTWVGETGVRLSGGQARRLTLARALLKPASLVILDEPMEGLDSVTAEQVMAQLLTGIKAKGQSLILITHQPYGLKNIDEIMVVRSDAPS